jgi:hypothetical protein
MCSVSTAVSQGVLRCGEITRAGDLSGANLTRRNMRNQTPIDTAMPLDHCDVAEVIRQATALSR